MNRRLKIPTGFCPSAQGCRVREATLGQSFQIFINPNGVVSSWRCVRNGRNPVGVGNIFGLSPRVARGAQPWALRRNPFGIHGESDSPLKIPTGFRPPAQGCEARATLGYQSENIINPNGVVPLTQRGGKRHNPVRVGIKLIRSPRVARSSQPWALCRNPFGIRGDRLLPRLISGKLPVENLAIQFPPGMAAELRGVIESE